VPGSSTTPGRTGTRAVAPIRIAFRQENGVGTRERTFAAPWLACALPYRRFAIAGARLGADAVRYTFIVADFHRLLLAGLTGALWSKPGPPWRRRVGLPLILGPSGTRPAHYHQTGAEKGYRFAGN